MVRLTDHRARDLACIESSALYFVNFDAQRLPNLTMPTRKFNMIDNVIKRLSASCCPARWGCVACVGLVTLLAGCVATQPQTAPSPPSPPSGATAPRSVPNVNLSGYPPAFKEGFTDGCDSLRGNYRRDANRFGKDNNYTLGWQDGYSICGRQKRSP